MKRINLKITQLTLILFLVSANAIFAQNFTWMKGSNSSDQPGLYGTLGVSSATNNPGGRAGACTWKDASGNFWMFGGVGLDAAGNDDYLNDLWKYTLVTNEWTWIGGDSIGYQAGVYGVMGMSSPTNKPGSRGGASAWVDAAGDFYMFGGAGVDAFSNDDELNDLWKYSVSTNEWTWLKGSNATGALAVYGTQGISSVANTPGGSYLGAYWTDANGNFWLFGGEGDDASAFGDLHDLWKYSVSTNEWTWMKGNGLIDQNGNYGTLGVPAASNIPGSRFYSCNWVDAAGNLWLFGGEGFDASSTTTDMLNDQWKYSIATNEWTWIKGNNTAAQGGTYGTQGLPAATNMPGARLGGMNWRDPATGDFYLFGGTGYFTNSSSDDMNDLWRYSPAANQWVWLKGNNNLAASGVYGTLGTTGPLNIPGSRYFAAGWMDSSNNFWMFGGEGVPSNIQDYGYLNDLWMIKGCAAPVLTITANHGAICKGESVTIKASGASTYSWSTSPAQTNGTITVFPAVTTTYVVTGTSSSGCQNSMAYTQTVNTCSGISETEKLNAGFKLYPNPNKGEFTISLLSLEEGSAFVIFNALGQKVFEQELTDSQTQMQTGLQKGIYFYQRMQDHKNAESGKIIIE